MGTAWQPAGQPGDCYPSPLARGYRPRHAAPPGLLRGLFRPADAPAPMPAPAPVQMAFSSPETTAMPPSEPERWPPGQYALPASAAAERVSLDWASWTHTRWDRIPPQR